MASSRQGKAEDIEEHPVPLSNLAYTSLESNQGLRDERSTTDHLNQPQFAGSNPAEAGRVFQGEKIPSTPSFGREVKPLVPCRRSAACKRSLN